VPIEVCPETVKQHENEQIYANAQQQILERAYPDRKCEIVLANLLKSQNEERKEIIELQGRLEEASSTDRAVILSALNEKVDFLYPSCVQRFSINQYRGELCIRPWARYFAGTLYLVGTIVLVYCLIEKTYKVLLM